jgi:hypothetical protein
MEPQLAGPDDRKKPFSYYSLRVFSPAGAVEVNGSSKTGVDATIW